MNSVWNKFIVGYCKVDFLCVSNEPNWLGWILLFMLGVFFSFCTVILICGIIESEKRAKQLKLIQDQEELRNPVI